MPIVPRLHFAGALSPLMALTLVAVITMTSPATAADIAWRSGTSAVVPLDDTQLRAAIDDLAGPDRHVVVQFDHAIGVDEKEDLAAAGLNVLSYLGGSSFFASLDPQRLDSAALATASPLVAIEQVQSLQKLDPRIVAGVVPEWAVAIPEPDGNDTVGLYVLFHPDVDLLVDGGNAVTAHGGVIRDALESINGLVVEMPLDNVDGLADEDVVQWMEWPLPPMDVVNDSNRVITEANQAQAAPYNLDGSGVTVLVYDGGTARATHQDFQGRCTVRDGSGMHYHSTHVAGTVGGAGVVNAAYKGMAPGVTIESYGFQYDGSGIFLYSNPGDIESDYNAAINTFGADIANNSIGTNTETNGFDCAIQGNYGITSNLIDTIVRGDGSNPLFDEPFRIVWANGNERQGSRCDVEGFGDYYSTAPPACAKNHIAVGALNSNNDTMTSFSSWGPTDDGRLKPDVSAPGCQSNGDGGVTSTDSSSDTAYTTLCGTSMAAPTTTGLSALILEDFRNQYVGQPDPRNSTLKALLAHTAVDLGNTGPDYQFGYGSVRVVQAIDFMRTGEFIEESVGNGQSYVVQAIVNAGDPELKVTLAWDDAPGTPNVNPALVNNLDLIVTSPSAVRAYPWTLDPLNPSAAAVQTAADSINNIEQVLVNNPEAGVWTIEVAGTSVPDGPQVFSLVGDGAANVSVSISFPNGLPDTILPGAAQVIDVDVFTVGQSIVPGSPTMYYRFDGGTFVAQALTPVGGNSYQATLPAASCSDTPEFYFSVEGDSSGVVTNPSGAPASSFSADVGELVVAFTDDFETNKGWTVQNDAGLSAGAWARGTPVGGGDRGDPATDFDGSGQCYLTDPADGDTDVDGGITWLISPTFDLSGGDADLSYALWYTNNFGADPNNDLFRVDVSDDNGSNWTEVAVFGPVSSSGWTVQSFRVGDFVTPNDQIRFRFEASDLISGSVVEAGIDAVQLSSFVCENAIPPQITGARSLADHGGTLLGMDLLGVSNIEPRQTGVTTLEVTFDTAMDPATAEDPGNVSIVGVNNPAPAVAVTPSLDVSGTVLTITLASALPDVDCYTVDLAGMTASGTPLDPGASSFTVVAISGDVNLDGATTTSDFSEVKPHFGEPADAGNARFDFNVSGAVTTSDASEIKPLFNNVAPACP